MVRIGDKVMVKLEITRIVETKEGVCYGANLTGQTSYNGISLENKDILSIAEK